MLLFGMEWFSLVPVVHERRNRSAEAPYKTAAQRNIQASYHHLPFPELLPLL
jgi:hypothetical protein